MKNGTKKFYLLGSIVTSMLIICVAVLIGVLAIKDRSVKAETTDSYEVVIERVSTVTVYVAGSGVKLVESAHPSDDHSGVIHDLYHVEKNTQISLIAVNEAKVFTSWNVLEKDGETSYGTDINGSTSQKLTFNVTKDAVVSVNRRDTTTSDMGRYMTNRFIISEAKDLYLLQEAFELGRNVTTNTKIYDSLVDSEDITIIDYYDSLFKEDETWQTYTTNNQKIAAINRANTGYFARLQNGYYLVSQNFAYLDKDNTMPFVGIGNETYPFQGVMCGLNNNAISTISLIIQDTQKNGTRYYGLFGYLGENAVVRNLSVQTSIGISAAATATTSTIYAGGLAGRMNKAFLYNVDALSRNSIDINVNGTSTVYSGSIAGYMNGGIEEYAEVIANGTDAGWVIQSNHTSTSIYTGLLAGYASDTYVNDIELKVAGYAATVKNSTDNNNDFKVFMGNLFGRYETTTSNPDTNKLYLRNIRITGNAAQNLTALIDRGNAYVAGLIGYVNSTNENILIGKVNFQITNKDVTSRITATAIDSESQANMYTAGLFAEVVSNKLSATDDFKQGITQLEVDGKKYYRYDFIFNGNYYIESINNGVCSTTTGKTISAGLVAHGLFNINGTDDKKSNILVSSEDYDLTIKATQTSISNGGSHTVDHCMAALFTAYISTSAYDYTFSNINIFTNNSNVTTTRELSSKAIGDLHSGYFMGYSKDTNYNNINLYVNDSILRVDSLSYDAKLSNVGNSAFAGGFIGELDGDSNANKATMTNIILTGFDYKTGFNDDGSIKNPVGTTLQLTAIQNTQAGGGDYRGENYCGGLIGLTRLSNISNSQYIGSESDVDFIQMQGHQSPDSAFCGGLIGFSKNELTSGITIEITNCKVKNANVYGAATVTTQYDNPDIYVGGLLGAIYYNNTGTISINNCSVQNSKIQGIANERIELFVGGLLGCFTWNGTCNISNSYVYGCEISANQKTTSNVDDHNAYAAGISARSHYSWGSNCRTNIENCATIDTSIIANASVDNAIASGINGYMYRGSIVNCYSNAKLYASSGGTARKYGIGGNPNVTPSNSFYVTQNANNPVSNGTGLDFGPKEINGANNNTAVDLFTAMGNDYKGSNKYYIVLEDSDIFKVNIPNNGNVTMSHDGDNNISNNADIWINMLSGGSATAPTSATYPNDEARHDAGWFKLGTVLTYRGEAKIGGTITSPTVTYPQGSKEFVYNASLNRFDNLNYPYDYVANTQYENIGYTEASSTTTLNGVLFGNKYTIKVRDNIPQIKFVFSLPTTTSTLTPVFFNSTGGTLDLTSSIGTYTFENTVETDKIVYELIFTPNTEIEKDTIVNIAFKVGTTDDYLTNGFQLDIKANTRSIKYVTYAEYTPPINYQNKVDADGDVLGSAGNYYMLKRGSTTKLIPVFTRANDLPIGFDTNGDPIYPEYNSELNVDYVTYTLSNNVGTMKTNGEFVASTSTGNNNTYNIKVALKTGSDSETVYFKFVDNVNVTYTSIGSDISALTYATKDADYVLESKNLDHYGGLPKLFNVTINDTVYSASQILTLGWIQDESGNKLSSWDLERTYYKLVIPSSSINGNISVDIEMNVVYTIKFDLQCATFNSNYTGNQVLEFKVVANTTFANFFTAEKLAEVEAFQNGATSVIQGYLCTGFFLVSEANSSSSYGVKFDELKASSIAINTSYTFYARWNFLIELVEAPGTHIQTSFSSSFMLEITETEYDEYVNRTVAVPINAKKGYVFTVVKDEGFVGEADVKAYIISNKGTGTETITEITVEKYHEDMYLYFIPPEKITGYLVIVTSVSNSEVIVGENTSQVVDEVLPQDGIYTFKYAVNHKNTVDENGFIDQSFIYDSGISGQKNRNLGLTKDIFIQFITPVFDNTSNKLEITDKYLPKGTIIEVYYNLYVDNNLTPTKSVIGSYVVDNTTTKNVLLSQFKQLNNDTAAFGVETFEQFLSGKKYASEVYYFVVTLPNGYDVAANEDGFGNINNELILVGYYDPTKPAELKTEGFEQYDYYVEGKRTSKEFANIPIEGNKDKFDVFTSETSLQQKLYSATPSRDTYLEKDGDTYTFTDNKNFNYMNVTVSSGSVTNGKINMYDGVVDGSVKNTVVTSGLIEYGISKLTLELGYSIGQVEILGSIDGVTYEPIETINVDEISYKEYTVDFTNKAELYYYFKIDNKALSEIRIGKMILTDCYFVRDYDISPTTFKYVKTTGNDALYNVVQTIVGDVRHDGKLFMLAVQFKNSSNIVQNIDDITPIVLNVTYVDETGTTKNTTISCNLEKVPGKNVLYFNLSNLINSLNITSFDFTISALPSGYSISTVQLIETSIAEKPAMGEVRVSYIY